MLTGTNLAGVQQFGGHNYYFSWLDEDARVGGSIKRCENTHEYTLFVLQSLIKSLSNILIPFLAIQLNHKLKLKFTYSLLKVRNTKWDWFNARNYCRFVERINS